MTSSQHILLIAENGEEFPISIEKYSEEHSVLFSELMQISLTPKIIFQLPHSFDVVCNLVCLTEIGKFILANVYDAMKMYEICKIYEIKTEMDHCRRYLTENINTENVCTIYEFSCKNNDDLLQYHCWKIFDKSWHDIFFGKYWLQCGKDTVLRYVSRPIYETLSEKDLFYAVYAWCRMKIGLSPQQSSSSQTLIEKKRIGNEVRCIMEPFFPFIRFLAIDSDTLKNIIFELYIFSDDEISGIQKHLRNKENPLPKSICKTSVERRKNDEICLHQYTKKYNLNFKMDKQLKKDYEFFCEILVHEDCFVIEIILPIIITKKKINMKIDGRNITCKENLPEQFGIFNNKNRSEIELTEPLFLRKGMQYELHVEITDENISNVFIKYEANCFMNQLRYDHQQQLQTRYKGKGWKYLYFEDVILYF